MKKILFCLMTFTMCFSFLSACKANNDYEYIEYEDGIKIISVSEKLKNTDHLTLPDEIKGKKVLALGENAFYNAKFLKVTLSSNIKEIEKSAFEHCGLLKNVELNEGLEYIGKHAFSNCYSLQSVEIPFSTITIDDYAFYRCYSLFDLRFPDYKTIGEVVNKVSEMPKLKYIGDYAFFKCNLGAGGF